MILLDPTEWSLRFLGHICSTVFSLEAVMQNKWRLLKDRSVAFPWFPLPAGWSIDKMKMNGLALLSRLHSLTPGNASLQKIKWNNRAIDCGETLKLLLSDIGSDVSCAWLIAIIYSIECSEFSCNLLFSSFVFDKALFVHNNSYLITTYLVWSNLNSFRLPSTKPITFHCNFI